jgi:hypothetical protein
MAGFHGQFSRRKFVRALNDVVAGRNAPAPSPGLNFPNVVVNGAMLHSNTLPATGVFTIAHFSAVAYFELASGLFRPVPPFRPSVA